MTGTIFTRVAPVFAVRTVRASHRLALRQHDGTNSPTE